MSIEAVAPSPTPAADAPLGRNALLAELDKLAPEPSDTPATEDKPGTEPQTLEAVSEETSDANGQAPEPDTAPAPDADLTKRLEAIQKAERRAKESIAKDRADVEARLKALEPDLAELAELRELRKRVRLGDSSALLKFGEYTDDDAELVAKSVYALSKAASTNPQSKEAAARALRERESMSLLEQTRKELAELKASIAERDTKAAQERQVAAYLDSAAKTVGDDTPIVRNMFTKSPELARQRVALARDYLYQQTGEIPEPADVLKALEDVERNDLIARGIDPDLVLSKTAKPVTPVAGEKTTAKTLSNDLTKQVKPRTAPMTSAEEKAELLKALETGQLEV